MATLKKQVSYRLSEICVKELMEIAKRQNVSQADVITVLVHLYYTDADFADVDEWFDLVRMS